MRIGLERSVQDVDRLLTSHINQDRVWHLTRGLKARVARRFVVVDRPKPARWHATSTNLVLKDARASPQPGYSGRASSSPTGPLSQADTGALSLRNHVRRSRFQLLPERQVQRSAADWRMVRASSPARVWIRWVKRQATACLRGEAVKSSDFVVRSKVTAVNGDENQPDRDGQTTAEEVTQIIKTTAASEEHNMTLAAGPVPLALRCSSHNASSLEAGTLKFRCRRAR